MNKVIFTIGFTRKSAKHFFGLLRANGIKILLDTRLRPDGQLSGYAKGHDLEYFVPVLASARYTHKPLLAPDDKSFAAYKKKEISWDEYERLYIDKVSLVPDLEKFVSEDNEFCCLLCSEHDPKWCHRRILAEFIAKNFSGYEICHLK